MKADKQLPTEISSFAPDANHRRLILWFLTWYDVIVSLIVSLIMVLTVGPIVPTYSIFLLWPITYIGYACLRLLSIYSGSQSSHRTISKFSTTRIALADVAHLVSSVNATYENSKLHSRWPRLRSRAHSLALLAIALIFAIQVRTAAVSLHLPPDVDGSLWLLLTPSIRAASRKDSITWLVAIFGLAAIGNAIIHVFTSQHSVFLLLQGGATQTLWLLSICLLPALLARYISAREKDISDREKALEAALDVIKGIANILDLPAQRFPNEAASLIARRFAFDEVNILFATTQDDDVGEGLLFGGASSVNGQVLVDSGYVIPRHTNAESNRGITTWAAVHKEPCLVNDVWNHPAQLFLYSDQFPDTASELAIPILLGNEIVGVLDIQSKSTAAFHKEDKEILRLIATNLAVSLKNSRQLSRAIGLYRISEQATRRIFSVAELHDILQGIADVTRAVLSADVVVLYAARPHDNSVHEPVVAGEPRSFVSSADRVLMKPESAVSRAMILEQPQFISHAETSEVLSTMGLYSASKRSFIQREGILSSAAVPLFIGSGAVRTNLGVIFVNYRQRRSFDKDYKDWCTALGELSSLAIQNAILHDRFVEEERANMWREVHDGMTQYASMTRMLLEQLVSSYQKRGTLTVDDGRKLALARAGSHMLQQQINYLRAVWHHAASTNSQLVRKGLIQELQEYTSIVRNTLEIHCSLSPSGDDRAIPQAIEHEVLHIVRETVHNAVRHGGAQRVRIFAKIKPTELQVEVKDNGIGFDSAKLAAGGGLYGIFDRVDRLGGMHDISSQPQPSHRKRAPYTTVVRVTIPLNQVGPRHRSNNSVESTLSVIVVPDADWTEHEGVH